MNEDYKLHYEYEEGDEYCCACGGLMDWCSCCEMWLNHCCNDDVECQCY
jgi:hypothetical protein